MYAYVHGLTPFLRKKTKTQWSHIWVSQHAFSNLFTHTNTHAERSAATHSQSAYTTVHHRVKWCSVVSCPLPFWIALMGNIDCVCDCVWLLCVILCVCDCVCVIVCESIDVCDMCVIVLMFVWICFCFAVRNAVGMTTSFPISIQILIQFQY